MQFRLKYGIFLSLGNIVPYFKRISSRLLNVSPFNPNILCGFSYKVNFVVELATGNGQDLKKIQFKDQSWLGLKTRSRDATLSRHKGIDIGDLSLHTRIAEGPSGETWKGRWQKNDIVAKILAVRECTPRISRDFNEEFPKLR